MASRALFISIYRVFTEQQGGVMESSHCSRKIRVFLLFAVWLAAVPALAQAEYRPHRAKPYGTPEGPRRKSTVSTRHTQHVGSHHTTYTKGRDQRTSSRSTVRIKSSLGERKAPRTMRLPPVRPIKTSPAMATGSFPSTVARGPRFDGLLRQPNKPQPANAAKRSRSDAHIRSAQKTYAASH